MESSGQMHWKARKMNVGKEVIGARTKGWGHGGEVALGVRRRTSETEKVFRMALDTQSVKNRTNSELIQGIWENDGPI